jgi:hypothetical protein
MHVSALGAARAGGGTARHAPISQSSSRGLEKKTNAPKFFFSVARPSRALTRAAPAAHLARAVVDDDVAVLADRAGLLRERQRRAAALFFLFVWGRTSVEKESEKRRGASRSARARRGVREWTYSSADGAITAGGPGTEKRRKTRMRPAPPKKSRRRELNRPEKKSSCRRRPAIR